MAEWMAYHRLEPFGPLRWAQLAATVVIACLAPWRKRNSGDMKTADVFPELGDKPAGGRATTAALLEKVRAWAMGRVGKRLMG